MYEVWKEDQIRSKDKTYTRVFSPGRNIAKEKNLYKGHVYVVKSHKDMHKEI